MHVVVHFTGDPSIYILYKTVYVYVFICFILNYFEKSGRYDKWYWKMARNGECRGIHPLNREENLRDGDRGRVGLRHS